MQGSPYTPGAGTLPPILAGRDPELRAFANTLNDVGAVGRIRAQDVLLLGPRGVGKTVTLTAYGQLAARTGFEVINLQAVAGSAGLVDSLLQWAAQRQAEHSGPWARTKAAFDRIAQVNVGAAGITAGLTKKPDKVQVTVGPHTLATALADLADEVRKDESAGGVLITVDEVQVAAPADLTLLAAMLHRLNVDHRQAPVLFAGTGLPHTAQVLSSAGVTHPDRLFRVDALPVALTPADATYAIAEPARLVGVNWHPDALAALVEATGGYPAHLQQFAHTIWLHAVGPHLITVEDVRRALPVVENDLARRTLGPRFDRMTDRQLEYLTALAALGGRAGSATLAATLGRDIQELSWIRDDLIKEGDIYAPQRGQIAMTVPILAPYLISRYEQARENAEVAMLSLTELQTNAAARRRLGT